MRPTRPAMAPLRHASPLATALALCTALAGCTMFGGENTQADKSDYDGGVGFALAITNDADDPFDIDLRVIGVGNTELARIQDTLDPGQSIEKWYSLDSRSTYSARLEYNWSSTSGSTSRGLDDQTFAAQDCPLVSRLAWELQQTGDTAGHRFLGKTCVTDE